jgi:Micrococcal nuclease (thermonuclease) homologs
MGCRFYLSPALSVVAKESGYQFIARMFPDQPQFYRSALFVRSDSPIYSLKDLNSQTKVGLGDFKSMSSFYMPLYDLYGKTLTIKTGLKRMSTQVKNGVVQVGAGVSTNVEKDRELRIIHVSRDIPGSGVYVTPTFSEREKTIIQQLLLNAPKEIQSKANYGPGKEPDYTEFMKIRTRVEEILSCADFSKNPVKLFCSANPLVIKGKINGSSLVDSVTLELKVMGENGTLYKVVVPRFIIPNFTQAQNKSIILKPTITPRQIDVNTYEVIITDPDQISIEEKTISSPPIPPSPELMTSPSPTNTSSLSPTQLETPSGLLVGYVANVWDGDNITIKTPQNSMIDIRLACIDAPERGQAPWGERSTQYLKQLLPLGAKISYRPVGTDRYGRVVAEIFVNNQSINLKMVLQGEAVVYHRYLSSCEADRQKYLDAETQAQRQSLGFWSQPDPEMPWDFRRRNRN